MYLRKTFNFYQFIYNISICDEFFRPLPQRAKFIFNRGYRGLCHSTETNQRFTRNLHWNSALDFGYTINVRMLLHNILDRPAKSRLFTFDSARPWFCFVETCRSNEMDGERISTSAAHLCPGVGQYPSSSFETCCTEISVGDRTATVSPLITIYYNRYIRHRSIWSFHN